MGRFYLLKPEFRLRGYERLPYAITWPAKGRAQFVRKDVFDAITLCNGKIDVTLPFVPEQARKIIEQLEKEGVVAPCRYGETLLPMQEYKKYPARYIKTAHWSITGGCNYKCKHCYMSAPDAKYGQLPHETIMKMIDELYECGVLNVSLTGGEPLIRPDFMEIVDALLEREIHITQIYSNGKLVTKELLQQLDERGIHPEFNMSHDGVGWHDWLRGVDGAEEAVDRAFLLCREMGFPTGAETCLHEKNKDTLRTTMKRLGELGCRSVKTNPVGDVGEWKKNGFKSLDLDEMYQLYFDYIPQYYEDEMPISLQLGGFFSASPEKPDWYDIPMYKNAKDPTRITMCGHARQVMYISPEGRSLPCLALSGMDVQQKFPLIPEKGVSKCITDSFYMNMIDTRVSEFYKLHPDCDACEFKRFCCGGCRASALEFSDDPYDLMAVDEACCRLYKDGWVEKIIKLMHEIKPEAKCLPLRDEFWQEKTGIKTSYKGDSV